MAHLSVVNSADVIAEQICSTLGGKKSGNGYSVKCPVHEDRTSSLSVSVQSGKLLIHCHAGCEYTAVAAKLRELKLLPEKLPRAQRAVVACYPYHDAEGRLWFEKLRYYPKEFRIRGFDESTQSWKFSGATKDAPKVLYRLPGLVEAVRRRDVVVICEGEKDADSFAALDLPGFFATANFEGSKGWCPEYTAQVAGAQIVLLEDNDQAGQERTHRIAAALKDVCPSVRVVRFPDVPPKGDFTDWLERSHPKREDVVSRLRAAEPVAVNEWLSIDDAKYRDYIQFTLSLPGITELRKERLSHDLYARTKEGWKPVDNMLRYVRGHARDYPAFVGAAFEECLDRYRKDELEPQLLVDIPEWDGVDRIKEVAQVCRFANLGQEEFEELLKHFAAGLFRRLDDNEYQNPALIFTGIQGAGKDSLLNALFGGLGSYFKQLDIRPQREAEAVKQLHTAILFNVPEFDRTARAEISTLKHLLTTPTTDVRLSYDRRDEQRTVHASFVGSANLARVITDHTGGRRYWVFEAEYLGLEILDLGGKLQGTGKVIESYPGLWDRGSERFSEQLQLLAQYKALCAEGYRAPEATVNAMRQFVAGQTPEAPETLLLEEFDDGVRLLTSLPAGRSSIDGEHLFTLEQVAPILEKLQRGYGWSRQKLLQTLGDTGRRERKMAARLYRAATQNQGVEAEDVPF